jgi:heme/copper-type cytochrome/quinol oxidase subunit 3
LPSPPWKTRTGRCRLTLRAGRAPWPAASCGFTLTGFHGTHVTVGVIWLGTLLAIDYKRGLGPKDALQVDLAALYWHFVDVVWIAIFTLIYLIQ